jgi:hypothetical protein
MESPGYTNPESKPLQAGINSYAGFSPVLAADIFNEKQFCGPENQCSTPTNSSSNKYDLKRLASSTTADSPKKLFSQDSAQTMVGDSNELLKQILTTSAHRDEIASFIDCSDGEDCELPRQLLEKSSICSSSIKSQIVKIFEGMHGPDGFINQISLHEKLQQAYLKPIARTLELLPKSRLSLKNHPDAGTVIIPSRDEVSLKNIKIPSFSPDPSENQSLVFYDRFSEQPYASLLKKPGIKLVEVSEDEYAQSFEYGSFQGLKLIFSQFFIDQMKERYKAFLSLPNEYFAQFQSPFERQIKKVFLRSIKHNPADLNYLSIYVSIILALFRLYHDLLTYFIRVLTSKAHISHFDRFQLLYFGVELDVVKALNRKFCSEFFSEVAFYDERL